MNTKEIRKSYFALIVIHSAITLGFALVFGTNHPFSSQYLTNDLYPLIISSMTFATVLYIIGGYLFVVAKDNKSYLIKHATVAAFLFALVLSVLWFTARTLSMSGAHRNIWLLYVISNYPTAIIYNSIINLSDIHALELVLTVIPPALGFLVGIILRLINEPQWRKKT